MSQTCRFGQYEGFHNYHRINYLRKLCVTIHWKSFVSKFDGLASEHVKGWDGWWGWREGGGAEGVHGGSGAGATSGAATARRQRRQSSVGRHWLDGSHASPFLCVWRSFHLPLPPPSSPFKFFIVRVRVLLRTTTAKKNWSLPRRIRRHRAAGVSWRKTNSFSFVLNREVGHYGTVTKNLADLEWRERRNISFVYRFLADLTWKFKGSFFLR